MVKIERTNGEKAKIAIISLEKERNKESGTYNTLDVFDALNDRDISLIRFYYNEL